MLDSSLPWLAVKLGDVVLYGKTEKCELSDVTDDTWILELEDIEKNSSRIIEKQNVAARPFKSTKNRFSKRDVLYGKLRPYLNKVVIADHSGVCSTEIIPLNAEPYIDNRFLFYWLKNKIFLDYVNSVSYGVNMPRLGTKEGLLAPFIVAPLAEQKVISDKLDVLLAKVEQTKARLERIPELLKTFRQSVLSAAVSGKLTTVAVSPLGKLKHWAHIVSGLAFKKSQYSENGSRLLQIANVGYGNTKWDSPNYIPIDLSESCSEYSMEIGDIVLALNRPITNDTLKVARIQRNDLPATLYQRVARIRCDQKILEPRYLFLIMQSPIFLKLVKLNLKGSDQPYLNTTELASFEFSAPTPKEQIEIINRVEKLFAFADNIEQKANAALERVNNLTQSILAKAFRGELTADWRAANPDLISGENSAESLLEKIKTERNKDKIKKNKP